MNIVFFEFDDGCTVNGNLAYFLLRKYAVNIVLSHSDILKE